MTACVCVWQWPPGTDSAACLQCVLYLAVCPCGRFVCTRGEQSVLCIIACAVVCVCVSVSLFKC